MKPNPYAPVDELTMTRVRRQAAELADTYKRMAGTDCHEIQADAVAERTVLLLNEGV